MQSRNNIHPTSGQSNLAKVTLNLCRKSRPPSPFQTETQSTQLCSHNKAMLSCMTDSRQMPRLSTSIVPTSYVWCDVMVNLVNYKTVNAHWQGCPNSAAHVWMKNCRFSLMYLPTSSYQSTTRWASWDLPVMTGNYTCCLWCCHCSCQDYTMTHKNISIFNMQQTNDQRILPEKQLNRCRNQSNLFTATVT